MLFTAQRPTPQEAALRIFLAIVLGFALFSMIDHAWPGERQTYMTAGIADIPPSPCQPTLLSTADVSDSWNQVLDLIHCRMILSSVSAAPRDWQQGEAQISLK